MGNLAVEILRQHERDAIDDLTASVIEVVPRYALADSAEVRRNVEMLFQHFLVVVETKDTSGISAAFEALARRRTDQGFSPSDFLRALLLVYPVVRRTVRKAGPRGDAALAHSFDEVEDAVFRLAALASNVYAATQTRDAKRQVQELGVKAQAAEERSKAAEADAARSKGALREAEHFTDRVIASLSAGIVVIEHPSALVRLWSGRTAEITGIESEDAVGKPIAEVTRALKGLPTQEIISTVRSLDRLPLTKLTVTTPAGQKRVIFLRAERLAASDKDFKGTVVVLDDITERELLIDSFSRYVSRDVVQRLLSRGNQEHKLEGERRACSVLFADIRGFTTISERVSLESLHALLNEYFRVMIDQVNAHDGLIDKFIGDKVMAVFTSRDGEGATAATRAALGIQREIRALNEARKAQGEEPIEVGIGINTGVVVMGTVGSAERMSFTVIGDVVNVADRLQGLAAAGETLVGRRTRELLAARFVVEAVGERALKGRASLEDVSRVTAER